MTADQRYGVAQPLGDGRLLARQKTCRLDEARNANQGVAPRLPGNMAEHLGHLHRVVARFCPFVELAEAGGYGKAEQPAIDIGLHMQHGIDLAAPQQLRGDPVAHAAGAAAGAELAFGDVAGPQPSPPAEPRIVAGADRIKKPSAGLILVWIAGCERTDLLDLQAHG